MEWIQTLLISGWCICVYVTYGCMHQYLSCLLIRKYSTVLWLFTLPGLCIPSFCADYRQHCIIETPKSWSDAQSYCRERGYDLATIDDMGAVKSLLALNADKAHDELWIGLRYGGPEDWHWSLADKDFYKEGERNYRNIHQWSGDRMVMQYNSMWSILGNQYKFWLVCYDGKETYTHEYGS